MSVCVHRDRPALFGIPDYENDIAAGLYALPASNFLGCAPINPATIPGTRSIFFSFLPGGGLSAMPNEWRERGTDPCVYVGRR